MKPAEIVQEEEFAIILRVFVLVSMVITELNANIKQCWDKILPLLISFPYIL